MILAGQQVVVHDEEGMANARHPEADIQHQVQDGLKRLAAQKDCNGRQDDV